MKKICYMLVLAFLFLLSNNLSAGVVVVNGKVVCISARPQDYCCVMDYPIYGVIPVNTVGAAPNITSLNPANYSIKPHFFIPDYSADSTGNTGTGVIDGEMYVPINNNVADKYYYIFDTSTTFTSRSSWISALAARGIYITL